MLVLIMSASQQSSGNLKTTKWWKMSSLIRRQNVTKSDPVYYLTKFDYTATHIHTLLCFIAQRVIPPISLLIRLSMAEGGTGGRYDHNCIKENSIHLLKVLRGTLSYVCNGSSEPEGRSGKRGIMDGSKEKNCIVDMLLRYLMR